MPSEFSFDVVSKVDLQAIEDAVHIANKEMTNRFDFKGSISKIDFDKKESKFTLASEDELKLRSVIDILNTRLAKRGVPLKNLDPQKIESAMNSTVRQVIKITQGIPTDKGKEIVASIKAAGIKVQASIQADQVRVTSKSKDELQNTMAHLRGKDFGLELQFSNYR